jgi:hypothetical protein
MYTALNVTNINSSKEELQKQRMKSEQQNRHCDMNCMDVDLLKVAKIKMERQIATIIFRNGY